jgi:uncharacterized protein YndB with AHSA1/START domain
VTGHERSDAVTQEMLIGASPETVFEFFVDPALMRKWMGGHAILEAQPGGRFEVDIGSNRARGSFVEVVRPRRIVFTWGWEGSATVPPGSSTVIFTFEATDAGTLLRMVHQGLPKGEDIRHSHGWTHFLSRLMQAAVGVDPGPDPHADGGNMLLHDSQP